MIIVPLEGGTFSVMEGRDGWLFLDGDEDLDVMSLYTDPTHLPQEVVDAWCVGLRARRELFASMGIVHLTVIAPGACLVYPEALPSGVVLSGESPAARIAKALDKETAAEFLYLLEPLVEAKAERPTYMQTDSHWSDWGAFVGYQATIKHLASAFPGIRMLEVDDLDWVTREYRGALGAVMPEPRSEFVQMAHPRASRCRETVDIANEFRDRFIEMEQDRPELPRALIFRDSSMSNGRKFFSESFRRSVYCVHPNAVLRDLVEREKPDVVITLMGERRLIKPPADETMVDFRAMFGDLLMDDPEAVKAELTSRSLLSVGDAAGALGANATAMLAGPTARLLMHQSRCLAEVGDHEGALESMRRATLADPGDGPVWFAYGDLLRSAGRSAEALDAYVQAAAVERWNPNLWMAAIRELLLAGRAAEAVGMGAEAIGLHPSSQGVRYAYACALSAAGSLEPAAEELRTTVSSAPAVVEYRRTLASVLVQLRSWGEAEVVLKGLMADDPGQPAYTEWLDHVQDQLVNDEG